MEQQLTDIELLTQPNLYVHTLKIKSSRNGYPAPEINKTFYDNTFWVSTDRTDSAIPSRRRVEIDGNLRINNDSRTRLIHQLLEAACKLSTQATEAGTVEAAQKLDKTLEIISAPTTNGLSLNLYNSSPFAYY